MDAWSRAMPRYNDRTDFKPDDETPEGVRQNYRLVCQLIDSQAEVNVDFNLPVGSRQCGFYDPRFSRLSGEEVLNVNAVFYRFEMHHKRPPACLGVDCTVDYRESEIHEFIDCDGPYMRTQHRCAFTLQHTDAECAGQLLETYDAQMRFLREADAANDMYQEPLPRDKSIVVRKLLGHKNVKQWRSPKPSRYLEGVYGADASTRPTPGPLNTLPASDFRDVYGSTMEARRRLVATLCWFRRHRRFELGSMIFAMRRRAFLAAAAYDISELMREAATEVIAERARQPDVLTRILGEDESSEGLGQALWPYLPPEAGPLLMSTCKAMRAFGERHDRMLELTLTNTLGEYGPWEREAHRIEPDGSLSMLKNRRIRLQPLLQHRFLAHVELPGDGRRGLPPRSALEPVSHVHLTHGSAIDPNRSTTRVFLVFDDAGRTEVGCFGTPALRRFDGETQQVGPYSDLTYNHFPRRQLPVITVSAHRLSSEFVKRKYARVRIAVEVSLVHKDSPPDVLSDVTHTAWTPPFRVVARLESENAAAASRRRRAARKGDGARHVQLVRDNQPATAADMRDQNFDALSLLDYEPLYG